MISRQLFSIFPSSIAKICFFDVGVKCVVKPFADSSLVWSPNVLILPFLLLANCWVTRAKQVVVSWWWQFSLPVRAGRVGGEESAGGGNIPRHSVVTQPAGRTDGASEPGPRTEPNVGERLRGWQVMILSPPPRPAQSFIPRPRITKSGWVPGSSGAEWRD